MSISIHQSAENSFIYNNLNHTKTSNSFNRIINQAEMRVTSKIFKPQTQSSSIDYDIYQIFQSQVNKNTSTKSQVNSYRAIGDTFLNTIQLDDLLERYDLNHLSESDTKNLLNELTELGVITKEDRDVAMGEVLPKIIGVSDFTYASWVPMELRRPAPNFSLDYIVNGKGSMLFKLNQKISFCNTTIEWLSDENNRGINQYEDENRQRLETYRESCEKVLNVIDTLKTI